MKYKYKPYANLESQDGEILTFPIVNVTFKNGRKELNIECLVDSGASETLLNTDIANLLGIDLIAAKRQPYTGIGNFVVNGYKTPVKMKVSGFDTWLNIEAGFIDQNEMPLLGHSGFFENYEVTFKAYQNRFEIKSLRKGSARSKRPRN